MGTVDEDELRGGNLAVTYVDGCSPLKLYRLTPAAKMPAKWRAKYRRVKGE